MSVWAVLDSDYDLTSVSEVYSTEALAVRHVAELGGWMVECEVRDTPHPDIDDPVKQAERIAAQEKAVRRYQEDRAAEQEHAARRVAEVRPHDRMSLCKCVTFSRSERRFINGHGYCSFCGGFEYEVFRQCNGEAALQAEIDKLAIHDREEMRQIVLSGGGPEPAHPANR